MSSDSLKANLSNPARTYLWEVIFSNPLSGNAETLMLRAISTSEPERSVGSIKIPFKQTAGIKFPGKVAFPQTWDITFVEGEDRAILDTFTDWLDKVVNSKTGLGALVIKTDVYLNLINTDGSIAKKIRLIGCYPEKMASVPLSADDDKEIRQTITLSYDRWEKA
jgi:hypothetical protein